MKKLMVAVLMLVLSTPVMADTGGGFLGALLGAAIGSQVGDGNGKKLATIVGVLAGASIGSRLEDGTYGKDAQGEYVCTNCNDTTYAQQQQYYQGNSGYDREAEVAAARGEATRLQREHERERAYTLRQAYCSRDPEGCSNGLGYAYNNGGGHNYAGSYYNRNNSSQIPWR